MRILHITQRYWPAYGGAEIHLAELSARLVAAGHEVTVLTTNAWDLETFWNPQRRHVAAREETTRGVRILRFPLRYLPAPGLSYPGMRRLLWLMSRSPLAPLTLLHFTARFAPWCPDLWQWLTATNELFDLVAAMNIVFEPFTAAALSFARRRHLPFVCFPLTHLGAGAQPGADPPSRFYTMRHQIDLVRRSDAIAAQTPSERAFYLEHGAHNEQIHVIGAGVNPEEVLGGDGERFRQQRQLRGPLVLFLSAMAYDKGAVTTVEAVRQLWRQGRQLHLVLAGSLMTAFQRYLEGLPAHERERLLVIPSIQEAEKRDLLAACDLLAIPSRVDSFGIAYLEAWLYSKPVIGASAWGIGDVINAGVDGLLVPFGDAAALASAIADLLDHPQRAQAMGAAGAAKVHAQHTWAHKFTQVHALYQSLVQRGQPVRSPNNDEHPGSPASSPSGPRVSVIIVNWNGRTHLATCLPALFAQSFRDFEVIVVDNGSTDGSVEWVKEQFAQVRVIQNQTNLGFAVANNQGIRAAQGKLVALLNNDTQVDPQWLAEMVEAMESDPSVGMVAAKMLLADQPNLIDSAGVAIDRAGIAWGAEGGQTDHLTTSAAVREVFGACGGAALYRRSMLAEIGLLDEDFFAYLEDVDLAWRAQWAGWRGVYAARAQVLHLHSATSKRIPHFKSRLLGRNKLWLLVKNYPWPHLLWYLPLILLYEALSLGYALRENRLTSALAGRLEALRRLPVMLAKRRGILQRISAQAMMAKLHPVESPLAILRRYAHVQPRSTNHAPSNRPFIDNDSGRPLSGRDDETNLVI
jgi:GT2 family glycosyltransferase/glycosyltransferase involved in cell wall biosynthesis